MSQSEVARLMQQIERECEAMKQGLCGLAITAQHAIIEHKYDAFGEHQEQLEQLLGKEEATRIAVDIYMKVIG